MEFRQRLGSGGFADVYEGLYEKQPVPIKKMKSTTKNPAATQEAFEAESSLLGLKRACDSLDHRPTRSRTSHHHGMDS